MNADEHTSLEAKKHAREILTQHGYPEFEEEASRTSKEHMTRVLAGYKAALHSKFLRFSCTICPLSLIPLSYRSKRV